MTTEQLALQAKDGNRAAKEALYFQVKPLMRKLASRYIPLCRQLHLTEDDLQQELYFALEKALQAFSADSEYCFVTYLNYPVQSVCRAMLHIQHGKLPKIPLSLEEPRSEDNGTLGASLEDLTTDIAEEFAHAELQQIVQTAVNRLPTLQKQIIQRYYFSNFPLARIAQELQLDLAQVRRQKQRALQNLRKNSAVCALQQAYFPQKTFFSSVLFQNPSDHIRPLLALLQSGA